MKKSIKFSVMFVALLGLTTCAKAQTTTTTSATTSTSPNGVIYSVGAEGGLTTGSGRDLHKWGVGGSIEADIPTVKDFYISINAAYDNFFHSNNSSAYSIPDINLLPVKAGVKYFPISNFYLQGEAGAAFILNKSDVGFNKTAAFIYTPQIGVLFSVGGQNYIDVGVNYESYSKFTDGVDASRINFFGLRVAYAFTGK